MEALEGCGFLCGEITSISAAQQEVVATKELFAQSLLNREAATFEAGKSSPAFFVNKRTAGIVTGVVTRYNS